jgi:hypothetical protein
MSIDKIAADFAAELFAAIAAEKTWPVENKIESFQEDDDIPETERKQVIAKLAALLSAELAAGKITKGRPDAERIEKILLGKI